MAYTIQTYSLFKSILSLNLYRKLMKEGWFFPIYWYKLKSGDRRELAYNTQLWSRKTIQKRLVSYQQIFFFQKLLFLSVSYCKLEWEQMFWLLMPKLFTFVWPSVSQ
jgi:hypothetical protein